MSSNATTSAAASMIQDESLAHSQRQQPRQSIFRVPAPVKRIFDRFPLVTYTENSLPFGALARRDGHVLHVFTTDEDARAGKPSFNPGCLRWQTYLRFANVEFRTVSSTNHASPSGILPFLLPEAQGVPTAPTAIPNNKLRKWINSNASHALNEPTNMRYEVYMSLLDTAIRRAWLYQLYLSPPNAPLAHSLYVSPCSSNPLVQVSIAYNLRQAAETELAKSSYSCTISETDIFSDAGDAFAALSELLGASGWFFEKPSMLDAALFAYTHLILGDILAWKENKLAELLTQYANLVAHRDRILEEFF